jgi:hypothetical protein
MATQRYGFPIWLGHVLYWMLVGAAFGFVIPSAPSLGIFVLPLAIGLLALGIIRVGARQSWGAVVGFGGILTLVFWPYLFPTSACPGAPPNVAGCGPIPPLWPALAVAGIAIAVPMRVLSAIWQSLLAGVAMGWQVLWSLVLGFTLSGMIQAYVSRRRMVAALGRAGLKEIALATGFGSAGY